MTWRCESDADKSASRKTRDCGINVQHVVGHLCLNHRKEMVRRNQDQRP
jgi:hypothetical protein